VAANVVQLGTLHGQKLQKGEQNVLDMLQSCTNSRGAEEIVFHPTVSFSCVKASGI
jgi:hypothetical protein